MDCILSFYVSYYRCFSHIQKKYIDKPPVTQYFQKCNRNRGSRSRGFSWEKCVLIVGSYGETSIREIAAVRGDFTNIATNSPYHMRESVYYTEQPKSYILTPVKI